MEDKYCIVTGANAGIGKEITAGLMDQGGHVVMACRNMQQCAAAKSELEGRKLRGSCECSRYVQRAIWGAGLHFAKHAHAALSMLSILPSRQRHPRLVEGCRGHAR